MTDSILSMLAEAEAIRVHGQVSARHPASAPLDGLLALDTACRSFGDLLPNRRRVSLGEWAELIEKYPDAGDAQAEIVRALRTMQAVAQPARAPAILKPRARQNSASPANSTL